MHVISAVSDFDIDISSTGPLQNATVGSNQTIQCTINTVIGVTVKSVIVDWMGPGGISITNSDRIMISPLPLVATILLFFSLALFTLCI